MQKSVENIFGVIYLYQEKTGWRTYNACCHAMLCVTLDCDDIVLIDEPRTYRLIENIMSTVAECFTSRRIHIGMDEAYRVGAGKFIGRFGRFFKATGTTS